MIRISVCMASYNGAQFINDQLLSIIPQLEDNDEIIISDDSSTDNTVEIVKKFRDKRIRLFEKQPFHSAVLNFENALKHARGEYIFLSDQDDIWKPFKVKHMVEALQDADLVVSDCNFIDETNTVIANSYFEMYHSGPGFLKNFTKNTYLGNCMAFNRTILMRTLPFPTQLRKASTFLLFHDVWIGLIANLYFRVKFIPDVLSSYRRHTRNASPTEISAKSPNSLIIKVQSRWLLLIALFNRLTNRA